MLPRICTTLAAAAFLAACADAPLGPTAPEADVALSPGQGAVVQQASGGGEWVLEVFGFVVPQKLGFSATKFADGSVTGQINYHQTFLGSDFHFTADVTCMSVYDGNRAKYGGEVRVSNDPDIPAGSFIWLHSIDNGQGASDPPDQTTGIGLGDEAANQAFCDSPALPNPLFLSDLEHGNIEVDG